ncbi:MAG: hypothetical protein AABX38_04395 [Candidatus Micrarchaeota archaeon]
MSSSNNNSNIFKSTGAFRSEIKNDLEANMQKFNDPLVIGELLYKLLEERENTNRILKNILTKLEGIEQNNSISSSQVSSFETIENKDILLAEIDEQIISYVKEKTNVSAEDVRKKFNYKGTNAASARLSRLYEQGLLNKKQVGKKVFYFLR